MNTQPSSTPTLDLDAAVAIAQKFNPNVSRQDVEDVVAQMGEEVEVEAAPTVSTMQATTELEGFYWGQPTAEDLALIEEHTGFSWNAEDWFMVPMRASDNLLWSNSRTAWHSSVLFEMAEQLPGQSLMADHNAYEIAANQGFYTRSMLTRSNTIPMEYLTNQGNEQENRDRIIQSGGWIQLYLMAAIHTSKQELIQALKIRDIEDVSTGTISLKRSYFCPHCTQEHGRDVDFYERNRGGDFVCPHSIPNYYAMEIARMMGEDFNFADYVVISTEEAGRHYETSFVGVGNLASAEVLRPIG